MIFPLEALGSNGVESWGLLLVLCFQSFVICLHLICSYFYVWCMAMPLSLWCCIAIGFSWFSSCLFLVLAFCVLRVFRNGWGKRKVNRARGELNKTSQVIRDPNEFWCMSKGKLKVRILQPVGWVGSIGTNGWW